MSEELVLVTGGSGFVGAHCIDQLLRAGYRVRTTVRSLKREADVRAMLRVAGAEPGDRLSFVAADLGQDAGWTDAVAGCKYVLHVASPFPPRQPKNADELIIPAREGALRILRAARDAGVKRVVMTSSSVAIVYGHRQKEASYDETCWTDLSGSDLTPYQKSKTLAERAAWDFIAREGMNLELSVVNPVSVFGPVLGPDLAASVMLIERFMDGAVPVCPRISFSVVDVRDVADLHLRAMTNPAARGERFLAAAGGPMLAIDAGNILKKHLGAAAGKLPTRQAPDWLVRILAVFIPDLRHILPELGKTKYVSNEKARRLLGWTPRSNEECIVATGESLLRLGLLKDKPTTPERT